MKYIKIIGLLFIGFISLTSCSTNVYESNEGDRVKNIILEDKNGHDIFIPRGGDMVSFYHYDECEKCEKKKR